MQVNTRVRGPSTVGIYMRIRPCYSCPRRQRAAETAGGTSPDDVSPPRVGAARRLVRGWLKSSPAA